MIITITTTDHQDKVLAWAAKKFGVADANEYLTKWINKHLSEREGHMVKEEADTHMQRWQKLPNDKRATMQVELDKITLEKRPL